LLQILFVVSSITDSSDKLPKYTSLVLIFPLILLIYYQFSSSFSSVVSTGLIKAVKFVSDISIIYSSSASQKSWECILIFAFKSQFCPKCDQNSVWLVWNRPFHTFRPFLCILTYFRERFFEDLEPLHSPKSSAHQSEPFHNHKSISCKITSLKPNLPWNPFRIF